MRKPTALGDQETHTQRVLGALPWSELMAGMGMHDRKEEVPRPPLLATPTREART